MRAVHQVAEAVDADLPGNRTARIQRDATRVSELAETGFDGPAYKVFEDDLCREVWPVLRGMLREGTLARIALKWCAERGLPFWVHPDDFALLRSSPDARDEILIDVLMRARRSFKRKALIEGGWNPDYKRGRGASCLATYGQCSSPARSRAGSRARRGRRRRPSRRASAAALQAERTIPAVQAASASPPRGTEQVTRRAGRVRPGQ
ncbi:hypothetical protein [Streptomyces chartreusis]|uniref:hypothetical protein n=1 Tax=Streptomyces chartreusis TaxID=1969 RepID=UPI002E8068CB|nr:hypothetical protein [Streptomyces chartreusis]WUB23815.1 hypothetical protein OG997_44590 [Streptomyces chartreusis]